MSTQKHTPGPWSYYEPMEQAHIKRNARKYIPSKVFRIAGKSQIGGGYVGMLIKSHPNESEPKEADLRLIAAAPTMLNALQDIVRVFGPDSGPGRVAAAAICKATGEPI